MPGPTGGPKASSMPQGPPVRETVAETLEREPSIKEVAERAADPDEVEHGRHRGDGELARLGLAARTYWLTLMADDESYEPPQHGSEVDRREREFVDALKDAFPESDIPRGPG